VLPLTGASIKTKNAAAWAAFAGLLALQADVDDAANTATKQIRDSGDLCLASSSKCKHGGTPKQVTRS